MQREGIRPPQAVRLSVGQQAAGFISADAPTDEISHPESSRKSQLPPSLAFPPIFPSWPLIYSTYSGNGPSIPWNRDSVGADRVTHVHDMVCHVRTYEHLLCRMVTDIAHKMNAHHLTRHQSAARKQFGAVGDICNVFPLTKEEKKRGQMASQACESVLSSLSSRKSSFRFTFVGSRVSRNLIHQRPPLP